ncbi:MAG: TonB-dependent receptor [Pseudomonadota bacterium]
MISTLTRSCACCAAFVFAMFPVTLFGDSADVEEIVVTATRLSMPLSRLTYAADVVTGDAITQARPLLGLDEALQGVPGLILQNRFNYAQDLRISMRGFGARSAFGIRGIRLIVDGIPETLPDGQGGVDGIDLSSTQRIEVLRGGAATAYGNAGGGVLLIETERAAAAPELRARAATGSDGYRQSQFGYSGQTGDVGVVVNLADLNYAGYRQHSAARNRQANVRVSVERGDSDWLVSMHHTDQPEAFDPGGITRAQADADPRSARAANVQFNAGEALQQTRLGLRYRWRSERFGELSVNGYTVRRDFAGRLPFANAGQIDIDRRFSGAGFQWQRNVRVGEWPVRVQAAADLGLQRDDRRRFDNLFGVRGDLTLDQRERVDTRGAALVADVAFTDAWSANVGVRHDTVSFDVVDQFAEDGDDSGRRTFRQWSPTAGVHWQVTPQWGAYASLSRSFETPTTTELANPSQAGGFNPALASTISLHHELGARWRSELHAVSAAIFSIDVDDELVPFELADFPGRNFFANAGRTDRRGIELSWSAQWAQQASTRLAYTWSDFRFDRFALDGQAFDSNVVPGTAEHVAFAALDVERSGGWFASAEASYTSALVLNNANTVSADAFLRLELRAGRDWTRGHWQLAPFVSVSNALDAAYTANGRINAFGQRFFEPGPDRAVFVGIRIARALRP